MAKSPPYFCLQYISTDKSKVEISQNFVAFSEYMNFKRRINIINDTSLEFPARNSGKILLWRMRLKFWFSYADL